MVIGYVFRATDPFAVKVTVVDPDPLTVVGEKDAVTPAGKPRAVKFTASPNPHSAVMVMDEVVELPSEVLTELGLDAMVKSGGPVTESVTVTV